jgi:hypothetical protein
VTAEFQFGPLNYLRINVVPENTQHLASKEPRREGTAALPFLTRNRAEPQVISRPRQRIIVSVLESPRRPRLVNSTITGMYSARSPTWMIPTSIWDATRACANFDLTRYCLSQVKFYSCRSDGGIRLSLSNSVLP